MKLSHLLICALLCACAPSVANAPIPDQWRAITVEARPVAFGDDTLGRLRFRGGVELRSHDAMFGGLSGLEVLDDNRFIALSDNGVWFEGRFALDADGALTGVTEMRTALMRDERGEPFANKESADSEDLTQMPDGRFAVSFPLLASSAVQSPASPTPRSAATHSRRAC